MDQKLCHLDDEGHYMTQLCHLQHPLSNNIFEVFGDSHLEDTEDQVLMEAG